MDKFRRVEIKYLIDEKTYELLKQQLKPYFKRDQYYKSVITNIYFDNDNYDLIRTSIEKPTYKEKIRLRSYGVPNEKDTVFLEIKKKCKGIVGKRRIMTNIDAINNYMQHNIPIDDSQNFKEIDYVIKKYDLKPKIFVAYNREAYVANNDSELRITLDFHLRSRTDDLLLEHGDKGTMYFKEPTYIMEIKTLGSMPLYLSHILSSLKIYPISFSKIGSIYLKGLMKNV